MYYSISKQVDQLCDDFEASHATDSPLSIPVLVNQALPKNRAALIRELIPLERELIGTEQADARLQGYANELPEFRALFDEFLSANDFDNEATREPSTSDSKSAWVGPYKLLQVIGEGGMGSVWMAQQEQPLRRRVAIKIIKTGMDSREVVARFEAERQAMAMMDHPNIAKILDAGTTADGQPFFAMELVKGMQLNEYCNLHELTLSERLVIFQDICQGVQHAHQKGILHRDLKPSNILVAEFNGKPVPKIIDFGLAKALEVNTNLTDKTMFTEFGQVIGTLVYMSPEQAGLDSLDIDTRSDIYTLGVILFELLTGSTPLQSSEFKEKALLQVLEMIREQDTPRPSNRIQTTAKDRMETVALDRKTDVQRLNQTLSGDLDWIAVKAVEKDRTRRYASAAALADDIQCYLTNEPVSACPPTMRYLMGKFVAKNRLLVTSAALVSGALLLGVFASTWFAIKADRAAKSEKVQRVLAVEKSNEAIREAERAGKAEVAANRSAEDARRSEKQANDVLRIIKDSFDVVNPDQGGRSLVDAKSILRAAQASLNLENPDKATRGELLRLLTTSFTGIGEYREAVATGQQALEIHKSLFGMQDIRTVDSLNDLGVAYTRLENYEQGLSYLLQAKEISDELESSRSRTSLKVAGNLADVYMKDGQTEKGLQLYDETRDAMEQEFGPKDPETLKLLANIGVAWFSIGRVKESVALLETSYAGTAETLGEDHAEAVRVAGNLGTAYKALNQLDKAIEIQQKVLRVRLKNLGPTDPRTLSAQNNLAGSYLDSGRNEEAMEIFVNTLEQQKAVDGPEHSFTLRTMVNTGFTMTKVGEIEKGLALIERAIESQIYTLGPEHSDVFNAKHMKAIALAENGEIAKSLELFEEINRGVERGVRLAGNLADEVARQRPQLIEEAILTLEEYLNNDDNDAAMRLAAAIPIDSDQLFRRVAPLVVAANHRAGKIGQAMQHVQRWMGLTESLDTPHAPLSAKEQALRDVLSEEFQSAENTEDIEFQSKILLRFYSEASGR